MLSSAPFVRYLPNRWGVAASLAILAFTGYLKWQSGLMPEHVAIPNPVMPSPNARDMYNRAESVLRDFDSIDLLPTQKSGAPLSKIDTKLLADKRRIVAENLPALALLQQGFHAEYLQPPARSASTTFPYFRNDRAMARLLVLRGQLAASDGDWSAAMSDDIDALQLGTSIQHGSPLIGSLVGIACEEAGRKTAWSYVDHLTVPQCEAAAKRIIEVSRQSVPFSRVLQEEEWQAQAILLEIYRQSASSRTALTNDAAPLQAKLAFRLESPRTAYDNYTHYTNEEIRRASLPWPTQKSLQPQPLPSDPINQILLPVFSGASALLTDNMALNNMLATKLTLRAYRLEHRGAYPSTLNQLAPAYLPSLPRDPFSDGQLLRYKLVNGQPLLYSVGPDAIDNGGESTTAKSDDKYPRDYDSGDIIAGNG